MRISPLSTLHRSLIAFSALHLGYGPRATVLATHQVTEADLHRHQADWQRLQALRNAEKVDNETTLKFAASSDTAPYS